MSRAAGLGALILAIVNFGCTSCICGYMDWISLPGNLVAFVLSWGAFVIGRDKRLLTRVIIGLACFAASLLLTKNGADILWLGHTPLLK